MRQPPLDLFQPRFGNCRLPFSLFFLYYIGIRRLINGMNRSSNGINRLLMAFTDLLIMFLFNLIEDVCSGSPPPHPSSSGDQGNLSPNNSQRVASHGFSGMGDNEEQMPKCA